MDLSFTTNRFIEAALFIGILVPSIMFHEVAHGLTALRLGDPTARDAGRLTFNPIKHVDLFGSVILPAMLALANGPLFGWAKPVPVNPARLRSPVGHMAITALAGPASNVLLAGVLARLIVTRVSGVTQELVLWVILINLFLAVFNLLPIPPLDGSRLLPLVLSERGREAYWKFQQFGFLVLFALLFIFDGSLNFLSDIVADLFRLVLP